MERLPYSCGQWIGRDNFECAEGEEEDLERGDVVAVGFVDGCPLKLRVGGYVGGVSCFIFGNGRVSCQRRLKSFELARRIGRIVHWWGKVYMSLDLVVPINLYLTFLKSVPKFHLEYRLVDSVQDETDFNCSCWRSWYDGDLDLRELRKYDSVTLGHTGKVIQLGVSGSQLDGIHKDCSRWKARVTHLEIH